MPSLTVRLGGRYPTIEKGAAPTRIPAETAAADDLVSRGRGSSIKALWSHNCGSRGCGFDPHQAPVIKKADLVELMPGPIGTENGPPRYV